MLFKIISILLLFICIGLGIYIGVLTHKMNTHNNDSNNNNNLDVKQNPPNAYYYETSEWSNGNKGVQYSKDDTEKDSLVYIPERNTVVWFHQRRLAHVMPTGDFHITWRNGGKVIGSIVNEGQHSIILKGIPGTSEEGITETMLRI